MGNLSAQDVCFRQVPYGFEFTMQKLEWNRTYGGVLSENYYQPKLFFKRTLVKQDKSIMFTVKKLESDLGFFCRLDQSFDSNMKVPLRLRLGTLDYVNKYEGKNPYVIFPYNN